MVIDLYCLTKLRARLMLSGFLVWLALPALSSAPHFEGAQFSVSGLSLTGPFMVCAPALPTPRHAAATATAIALVLMTISFPKMFLRTSLLYPRGGKAWAG